MRAFSRHVAGDVAAIPQLVVDGDPEAELLVELWSLGLLSATLVQQIAAASNKAAYRPQIAALADCGGKGVHRGNIHRDFARKLGMEQTSVPSPLIATLPMWDAKAKPPKVVVNKFPFMLPHELLAALFENQPAKFQRYFLGSRPLEEFWAIVGPQSLQLNGHPVKDHPNFRSRAIPLKLHGDGVPVGKSAKRSVEVISLSSLTGYGGSTWDTKLLICAIDGGAKATGTMDEVWRIIVWSLGILMNGKWRTTDHNGVPFPAGTWRGQRAGQRLLGEYIGAAWLISVDLDYLCNYLKLPHFNSSTRPCMKCFCNRDNIPWSDLKPQAQWRNCMLSPKNWYLHPNKHQLLDSPQIGLTIFHVSIDPLACFGLRSGATYCRIGAASFSL